jgi:hypothetical protein
MNDYFIHDTKLVPGTKARAEDVNSRFDSVVTGFERLPAPHPIEQGFADPVTVGAPTELTHAASVDSVLGGGNTFGTDTGIVNAYVVDLPIAPSSYREGLTFNFKAVNGNTGPSTVNLNSLGIKTLSRPDGSALVNGDIVDDQMCSFTYDGTKFLAVAAFKGQFDELVTAAQLEVALAASSATSAGDSETQTGLDAVATAADRVQTGLDVIATAADLVETNQDSIDTAADLVSTNADVVTATTQAGVATTKAAEADTSFNDTLSIFGDAVAVQAAVDAAEADKVQTGLDRVAVAADLVETNQDTIDTAADRVQTGLDRVQTGLDRVAVAADLVQTNQDTIDTAADLVETAQDVIDSGVNAGTATTKAAEAVTTQAQIQAQLDEITDFQTAVDDTLANAQATAADLVETNQDTIDTAADAVATAADRVQIGLDVLATAADLVETNQDSIDTAADLVATNQDTIDTAADRVQTGLDRTAAAGSAATAASIVNIGIHLAYDMTGLSAKTLDASTADVFELHSIDTNFTITLSNVVAGRTITIFFADGAGHVTWPSGIEWAGLALPELTAGIDVIVLTGLATGAIVGGAALEHGVPA